MADSSGYPVSIVTEGPTFRDELVHQPQAILREEPIESLRLVPAKSAATGVYTIYFVPRHREWALVRLALRYRWLFEIQCNRGMAGERQLLQQGFTADDLAFLFEIIPAPPTDYNPIVYDMLWLVATFEEYRTLTEAILSHDQFTPRALFESDSTIDETKIGFLTRFLRSHLIERVTTQSGNMHSHGTVENGDRRAALDESYTVTAEGETALRGILDEYDRIFTAGDFEPLFITDELDPRQHLVEHRREEGEEPPDLSFDEIQHEEGMLGEIASSFSSLVDDGASDDDLDDVEQEAVSGLDAEGSSDGSPADSDTHSQSRRHSRRGQPSDGSDSPTGPSIEHPDPAAPTAERSMRATVDDAGVEPTTAPEFGAFTETEVLDGTVAAAGCIHEQTVARVEDVKQAAWDAVDLGDRDQTELWEYVTQVLMAMDSVYGRPEGRIWTTV